ncbi:hypothetical protein B5181_08175 [Streptomyces sp. 4F]|nr:hypothetical protein B5181_08175 [Streptomyces sp. 4F]
MANDPIAGSPESAPADAGPPTERLRRGAAASPWQERGASADSPLASARAGGSRVPQGAPAADTAPRVYADTQTADTVSGAPGAPGCWDGPMAVTATRTPRTASRTPRTTARWPRTALRSSPVTARELDQRHVSTRRRHL